MSSILRSGLIGLAIVLAFSVGAGASTITYNQFLFISPVISFGSSSDVTASSNSVSGGYSFSGEFCDNQNCSTGAIPTSFTSLLRFTNANLTCTSGETCAPLDVTFEAQGASAPVGPTLINLMLTGNGTASGFARVCIQDAGDICSANLQGPLSSTFPFVNNITGSATGAFNSLGSFDVLGDFHINGLNSGASISLSNSFDIGFTSTAATPGVPEPSTMGLVSAALGALALLWRRSR